MSAIWARARAEISAKVEAGDLGGLSLCSPEVEVFSHPLGPGAAPVFKASPLDGRGERPKETEGIGGWGLCPWGWQRLE